MFGGKHNRCSETKRKRVDTEKSIRFWKSSRGHKLCISAHVGLQLEPSTERYFVHNVSKCTGHVLWDWKVLPVFKELETIVVDHSSQKQRSLLGLNFTSTAAPIGMINQFHKQCCTRHPHLLLKLGNNIESRILYYIAVHYCEHSAFLHALM